MTFFLNVREAPVVASEPRVRPVSWRIVRTPLGAQHLVAVVQSGSLRLTSPLKEMDRHSRTVVTESGRVYELDAAPADDLPTVASLMLRARLELHDGFEDISAEVWECMLASTQ